MSPSKINELIPNAVDAACLWQTVRRVEAERFVFLLIFGSFVVVVCDRPNERKLDVSDTFSLRMNHTKGLLISQTSPHQF